MRRDVLEELQRLVHGHVQHVGDALALVLDLQRLAVVAVAVADLARHVDVGQELHLDADDAVALARLAAAALDVEAEPARLVAAHLGVRQAGEEVADLGEQVGVGRRVRARRPADGRLVDVHHLVQVFDPLDRLVPARPLLGAVDAHVERLVQHLVHQARLAAAADAGDADELAQREAHVHMLQVVLAGPADDQILAVAGPARSAAPRSSFRRAGRRRSGCRCSAGTPRSAPSRPRSRRARPRPGPDPRSSPPRAWSLRRARPPARCCPGRADRAGCGSAGRCRAGAGRCSARPGCRARP